MALIIYNSIDIAIEEGATFVFGSWLCITDGVGGFSNYLAYSVSSSLFLRRAPLKHRTISLTSSATSR
jgi:hypothetical protein